MPGCASALEARSLQFFTECTLAGFETFFRDDLWNTQVLRLAQTEDSIRHALAALASAHETFLQQTRGPDSPFGLRQYNLAIQGLLNPDKGRAVDALVQLLSCLIFVCIEVRGACVSLATRYDPLTMHIDL